MKLDLLLPFLLVFSLFFKSSDPEEPTPHQHFCESHSVMEHLLKERKDIEAKHLKYEADWVQRQTNPAPKSSMEYVLPVVVHIIHDNGAANISDVLVEQGIQHLNQAFANTDYYDQGTGVNTSFQFCLAQRDPDGNATFGINRIVSPLTAMNLEADDLAVKNLSRWDPTQYVNIWLVREICSASSGCGVAGYAYLPAAHGSDVDGIVMEASWFGSSPGQSAVQVHEMGHYLGLYHTFEGGCGNNDCVVDGDRVCDTPPDQSTAQVPCEGTANSCFTDTDSGFTTDQNDMFINYMDYGDFDCYSAFTQGQTDRMVFTIEGIRQSLLLSQACLDPCPVDITANFTVPTTTIPIGTTLNFTNTSTNATTYSWSVGSTIFSTDTNSSFVFNDLGVFVVELVSTNSDPNCIAIARDTIEVFCPVEASYDISNANPLPGEIINFTNTSTAATTFSWTVNGMIQSTDTDYNTSFPTEGSYLVCLEANNGFCEDEECFFVIATIEEPCSSNSALITYGTQATDEMGDFLLPIPSGGMLMASTQNGEIVLSELDADLNPIWHQSLPITNNIDRIYELKLDSDNMLLGVGFTNVVNNNRFAYVFKYDYQNLDIIWTKRISGNGNTPALFSILEESPGGDYLLFGQTSPNNTPGAGCDATMIQIDRISGVQQFAKNFQLGSCETFQKAILHNSSIYTTGRFNAAGGGTNKMRPAVSQIDPFGNMIWSRLYLVSVADNARLYTSDIIEDGGDLVVLGRGDLTGSSATANIVFLYKIEPTGEIIWAREYDIPSGNSERTRNLVAVQDGYLALTNYREGSTPASILLKTDKDGELQWAKQFGSGGTMTAGRLEVIGDNIFILGGTDLYGAGGSDVFIAKLDLNGNLQTDNCLFVEDIELTESPINNPYDEPIAIVEYDSPYGMVDLSVGDVDASLDPIIQCIEECEEECTEEPAIVTYGTTASERGFRLLPLPAGGFILSCSNSISGGGIILSQVDENLELLWQEELIFSEAGHYIHELVLDSDNMLIGTGNHIIGNSVHANFCFKYDYVNQNLIWSREISSGVGDEHLLYTIMEKESGGNYLIFGQTSPNDDQGGNGCDAVMFELARTTGDQQWIKNYDLGGCETFYRTILHNGSIYATGHYTIPGGDESKIRSGLTQLDLSGNHIWSNLYLRGPDSSTKFESTDLIVDNNDLLVMARAEAFGGNFFDMQLYFYKVNSSGALLWARNYDVPGAYAERFRRIVVLPDGYALLGYTDFTDTGGATTFILKTDKQGVVQWAKNYGLEGVTVTWDLVMANGALYLCGGTNQYSGGDIDIFIARINLDGTIDGEDCNFVDEFQVSDIEMTDPYEESYPLNEYTPDYFIGSLIPTQIPSSLTRNIQCQEDCNACNADILVDTSPTDCDPTTLSLESECDVSTYYWTFCEPELTALPEIEPNIAAGNIPAMCDFVDATADGGGYHLFVTNYNTATERLRRLDFGNDINSVPTTTIIDLPGIPNTTDLIKNEGIDIIQSNGQYYGFFTVWNQIYRIEFGTDITNANPGVFLVAGYENAPIWWSVSLDLYQIEGQWWGIHTARSGELTILFWGDDVSGDVQAALSYTGESGAEFTGATYIEEAGNHYVLACDFQNGLMRFDFGTSLLNPPTMTNLGFFGTGLQWSVAAYRECEDGYLGFLFKETGDDHKVIRFSPSITSTPVVVNTINGLDRVNGTSSFHRVDDDLVFFVTRSYSQSVARLYYEGCNGVDIPNSTDPNPVVQFPEPGDYTVRVIVNEGLPDQLALCEQITVETCFEELCDDGVDNDGDGLIDCADTDLADSCCCLVPLPLDLGPDQLVCDFGVTVLQPEEDYASYRWQDGSTEASYTAFNPGTYWLEVTDSCGNILTDTIQIEVEEITVLELGPDLSICAGDTVQFSFSAFDQYEWFPSTGIDCATCPEVNINPDSTTMYTLVASSDLGCYSVDSVLIEVSGGLIRSDTIFLCAGDTAIIYGEPVFTTGTYSEIIPVANGCDSVFVTDVIVLDSIMVAIEMEEPCVASDFGAIMTDITGGLAPYSVSWTGPDGFTSTETDLIDILAGSYTLEIVDAFGCELNLVLNLDIANEVMLALEVVDVTCFGGADGILYLEGDDAYTYSLDGITYDTNPVYSGLSAGPYNLYIQDGNGCVFERLFAVFEPSPLLLLLPDDQTIDLGDSLIIEAQTSDATGLTYSWSPDNRLSCTDCPAPVASPWETTLYTLVVENEAGCSVMEDILISVGPLPKVYIPNAFSPNDDTINDHFTVYSGSGIAAINKLSIFDRWGELVFENTNFQPNDPIEGWDGSFRGEQMGVGIFVYVAEIEFINGLKKVYSGDFLLLR